MVWSYKVGSKSSIQLCSGSSISGTPLTYRIFEPDCNLQEQSLHIVIITDRKSGTKTSAAGTRFGFRAGTGTEGMTWTFPCLWSRSMILLSSVSRNSSSSIMGAMISHRYSTAEGMSSTSSSGIPTSLIFQVQIFGSSFI